MPDADALLKLADALETSVQSLLGMPEEASEPNTSEIATALTRINDQLAIQNRRRNLIWKVVAWIVGLTIAFNILLIVLGWAAYSFDADLPVTTTTYETINENAE